MAFRGMKSRFPIQVMNHTMRSSIAAAKGTDRTSGNLSHYLHLQRKSVEVVGKKTQQPGEPDAPVETSLHSSSSVKVIDQSQVLQYVTALL